MKNLIAISGKIASGKTTVSKHLINNHKYEMYALATPIKAFANWWKEYCELINKPGVSEEEGINKMYEFRQLALDLTLGNQREAMLVEKELVGGILPHFHNIDWSVEKNDSQRKLLQQIGQRLREKISPTIWIDYCIRKALGPPEAPEATDKLVVIDDIRYRNEADAFKKAGFTMVRLNVSEKVQEDRVKKLYGEVTDDKFNHVSETDLDTYDGFDITIDADAKLKAMLAEVDKFIKE